MSSEEWNHSGRYTDYMVQKKLWNQMDIELKNGKNSAQCNICGHVGGPFLIRKLQYFDWANSFSGDLDLRESLVCTNCGSSSRDRMLVWGIKQCLKESGIISTWKENKAIRILESAGRRNHPHYLKQRYAYYNTEYDLKKIKQKVDLSKYSDFQNLHFEDEYFDFVISSDVFEHIRLYKNALKEVFRVLNKNGKFILQVPYCDIWKNNLIKVKPEDDKDVFLTTPEYHAGNTLVYRIYGREFLNDLSAVGFSVDYICKQIPQHMISFQPIIICTK